MLPGLTQLEITPELFRVLFEGLTEEEAAWKPSPERWSIGEIIEHLSHVEGHVFRARIDSMLAEDTPAVPDYDQEKYNAEGQYSGRHIEDSFDHWEDQRETNVEYLRSLEVVVLARQGRHEKLGLVTIADVLNQWACHDLGHVRQVVELIRLKRYIPNTGPFQAFYQS